MLAVPFENLTIHLGGTNVLDLESNYHKIVVERRGGWCFELNGPFAWLLAQLGFDVTLLAAGVHMGTGYSNEFDHLALRVDLDEPWLVDVGFGENFTRPSAARDRPRPAPRRSRLPARPRRRRLAMRHDGEPNYRFALTPREMSQFEQSAFLQSAAGSFFTATPAARLRRRTAGSRSPACA